MRRIALLALLAAGIFTAVTAAASDARRTITVNGEATLNLAPDRATLRFGAVAQAREAQAAQQEVNEVLHNAIQRVKDAGVDARHIQTSGLQLSPLYSSRRHVRNGDEPEEPRIIGYRASNTLQVTVENVDSAGGIIDEVMAAGVNQLQGIDFGLQDEEPHKAVALGQAARRAGEKAHHLAQALNLKLGPVLAVQESGAAVQPKHQRMFAMEADRSGGTPIEAGQVAVRANVTLEYQILAADE